MSVKPSTSGPFFAGPHYGPRPDRPVSVRTVSPLAQQQIVTWTFARDGRRFVAVSDVAGRDGTPFTVTGKGLGAERRVRNAVDAADYLVVGPAAQVRIGPGYDVALPLFTSHWLGHDPAIGVVVPTAGMRGRDFDGRMVGWSAWGILSDRDRAAIVDGLAHQFRHVEIIDGWRALNLNGTLVLARMTPDSIAAAAAIDAGIFRPGNGWERWMRLEDRDRVGHAELARESKLPNNLAPL